MKIEHDVFTSKILDDVSIKLNQYILEQKDKFGFSVPSREKQVIIDDFIENYKEKYNCDLNFKITDHTLKISTDSNTYIFLLSNNEGVPTYTKTDMAYKKEIDKHIFIEITKERDGELESISFHIGSSKLNTISYFSDGCGLDNFFIYDSYKEDADFFWESLKSYDSNIIKLVGLEKTKKFFESMFDIYDLSQSLFKAEPKEYFEKFLQTVLTGKDLLEKDKDLLVICCDINLDQYSYKKLLVNPEKIAKTLKNN